MYSLCSKHEPLKSINKPLPRFIAICWLIPCHPHTLSFWQISLYMNQLGGFLNIYFSFVYFYFLFIYIRWSSAIRVNFFFFFWNLMTNTPNYVLCTKKIIMIKFEHNKQPTSYHASKGVEAYIILNLKFFNVN